MYCIAFYQPSLFSALSIQLKYEYSHTTFTDVDMLDGVWCVCHTQNAHTIYIVWWIKSWNRVKIASENEAAQYKAILSR